MKRANGGPAFPCEYVEHAPGEVGNNVAIMARGEGMTLRDYFAAGIAAAQCTTTSADTTYMNPNYAHPEGEATVAQKIARTAYAVADAMLAERAK